MNMNVYIGNLNFTFVERSFPGFSPPLRVSSKAFYPCICSPSPFFVPFDAGESSQPYGSGSAYDVIPGFTRVSQLVWMYEVV